MSCAVLLAGGLGSRLRPYTVVLPKPLMPIGEMPVLEVIIKQLAEHGIRRQILAVNHQADLMRAYFGSGEKFGVDISYSLESMPLGTMGPLRLVENLPEHFIVMNGDILTDLDLSSFMSHHISENRLFTVAAAERNSTLDYGVLEAKPSGQLVGFREKPSEKYLVSMGIYCVSRRVLGWIPEGRPFGFDNLMLALLSAKQPVYVERHSGYWLDIGRPDDYHQAIDEWPELRKCLKL